MNETQRRKKQIQAHIVPPIPTPTAPPESLSECLKPCAFALAGDDCDLPGDTVALPGEVVAVDGTLDSDGTPDRSRGIFVVFGGFVKVCFVCLWNE